MLIAGPTASGKSSLALHLASRLPKPLIINCDSMQVYADLSVVTARPSAQDLQCAHHALYGHRDGASTYSVAEWRDEVRALLARHPQCCPIFVGGTGLYFRALLEGLSPIPPVPGEVRDGVRRRLAVEGALALHGELDSRMADALSPTDGQRVARALEVLQATGKSLADWQARPAEGAVLDLARTAHAVLAPPRDWLEARIRERADAMLGEAAMEEVRALRMRTLSSELPVMRAIGVSAIGSYLDGVLSREEALEALAVQTRRYAKRQQTWFRGQMGTWPRFDPSAMSVDVTVDRMFEEGNGCGF